MEPRAMSRALARAVTGRAARVMVSAATATALRIEILLSGWERARRVALRSWRALAR
jgi:hypothetical protein